jgi:hypothetical protein
MDRVATVALARSPVRLAAVVGLRLAVGLIAVAVGIGAAGEGAVGTALTAAGALVIAYATGLAIVLLRLRVEVFPHELHLVGPLFRWRFRLAPGPLTHETPDGWRRQTASVGGFGVSLGEAETAEGERVVVIQLYPRAALLMVPTSSGRVAISASDEGRLIEALIAATRVPHPWPRSR